MSTQTIEIVAKRPPRDPDEVVIETETAKVSGWKSVRITRGIERCPSDFEVTLTELYPGESDFLVIRPGDPCMVKIGRDIVITGYVDRYEIELGATSHGVAVAGRGKCQDLVDCSAMWPGQQIVSSTVRQVAERLAEPYGIQVFGFLGPEIGAGPVNALLPLVIVPIGETVWSVVERLCRVAGLLVYELPDGNLFIGPGVSTAETASIAQQQGIPVLEPRRAASGFKEGVNVLAARAMFSNEGRYSDYASYRFGTDMFRDLNADGAANRAATYSDGGVGRYRLLAMLAEGERDATQGHAQDLIAWEAARRWGRSRMLLVTTDSWRDAAGALYEPNTLVGLELPTMKITGVSWLISEVTYIKGESGTSCELLLMRPEAFQVRPSLPPNLLPADQAALPPNLAQP